MLKSVIRKDNKEKEMGIKFLGSLGKTSSEYRKSIDLFLSSTRGFRQFDSKSSGRCMGLDISRWHQPHAILYFDYPDSSPALHCIDSNTKVPEWFMNPNRNASHLARVERFDGEDIPRGDWHSRAKVTAEIKALQAFLDMLPLFYVSGVCKLDVQGETLYWLQAEETDQDWKNILETLVPAPLDAKIQTEIERLVGLSPSVVEVQQTSQLAPVDQITY